jgi:hypothetical protein
VSKSAFRTLLEAGGLIRKQITEGDKDMENRSSEKIYPQGYYGKKMMSASDWAGAQIRKWEKEEAERTEIKDFSQKNCICLSRSIGAGALEVAESLSEITGYRVIDKEIMEHMRKDSFLTEKMIEFFDERFPGKMNELLAALSIENGPCIGTFRADDICGPENPSDSAPACDLVSPIDVQKETPDRESVKYAEYQ